MAEPATDRRCDYCGKSWDDRHDETTLYGIRILVCPEYDKRLGPMIALPPQPEARP